MRLINTDGMAFIGPGSEWFWTAVSGIVLAVTFIAIYRQLRMARSANAFAQIDRLTSEWESERALRYRLDICRAVRAGGPPEDVPEGAASFIADYWEHVAALVREGHVEQSVIHEDFGGACQWWWAVLAPNTRRYRSEMGSTSGEHFEWLASQMADMDRRAGRPVAYDDARIAATIDRMLQKLNDQVRHAEELRTVIVRPLSLATFAGGQAPEPEGA